MSSYKATKQSHCLNCNNNTQEIVDCNNSNCNIINHCHGKKIGNVSCKRYKIQTQMHFFINSCKATFTIIFEPFIFFCRANQFTGIYIIEISSFDGSNMYLLLLQTLSQFKIMNLF